jgi:hypothetical protein
MFHKYNSFTNTLSPSDQISAYIPQSFGTKEATNNFFVAPQPKGRQPGGSEPHTEGSLVGRQMSLFRFLTGKTGTNSVSVAKAHTAASTSSHGAVTGSHGASNAVHGHGHGHDSHAAPWEGVNLWRTPYKGDGETVTQIKRTKGTLDRYIENRVRRIQEMQLFALRNKNVPTWIMMPRDKIILAAEGVVAAYILYRVATTVYNHLKAKDRLKLLKLLYKDNVN